MNFNRVGCIWNHICAMLIMLQKARFVRNCERSREMTTNCAEALGLLMIEHGCLLLLVLLPWALSFLTTDVSYIKTTRLAG